MLADAAGHPRLLEFTVQACSHILKSSPTAETAEAINAILRIREERLLMERRNLELQDIVAARAISTVFSSRAWIALHASAAPQAVACTCRRRRRGAAWRRRPRAAAAAHS